LLDLLHATGISFSGIWKHTFDGAEWTRRFLPNKNNALHFGQDSEKNGQAPGPQPSLAIAITRFDLTAMLARALVAEGRAELVRGARVGQLEAAEGGAALRLTLADGSTLRATHVIGADGIRSAVRAAAGRLEERQEEPSFRAAVQTLPIWAIRIPFAHLPPDLAAQTGFAYNLFESKTLGSNARLIAANNGALSAFVGGPAGEERLVCWLWMSDAVLDKYPELAATMETGECLSLSNRLL
jgi:2-polyprenyl-6-methoxyphenol hydroxylase-like FAD-dependent oxidoreductase